MYQDFFNKNDDYLNEFKQKVANQKIASQEERRSEIVRARNNFIGTFAGIAMASVVGWFVLAPQYAEQSKEISVIKRPQTAVKVRPENPGGMDIPNQDKDVYSIVEKKELDNTVIENLSPAPEEPKLPETVIANEDTVKNNSLLTEKNSDTDSVVPQKPTDLFDNNTVVTETKTTNKTEEIKTVEVATESVKKNEVTTKTVKEKEIAKEEITEKEVVKPIIQTGNWQIQLVASKNKDAVAKTWKDWSVKYADLRNYSHEIQSSDLGSMGMFYRLRVGAFASKEEAAKICASLKAKGLPDCIAKERHK
jgi:cell division septation protein DedD